MRLWWLLLSLLALAAATDPSIFRLEEEECDFMYVPCGTCCLLLTDDDHVGLRFEDSDEQALRAQIERDLACHLTRPLARLCDDTLPLPLDPLAYYYKSRSIRSDDRHLH